jgi:hypothetical protein
MVKLSLAPTATQHALFLDATYTANGMNIPVQFIIDQPIELKAKWMSPVTITSTTDYLSMLNLSLAQFANGIDTNLLSTLTPTNGVIVISSTSNQQVYNMIMNNLENFMKVKFQ